MKITEFISVHAKKIALGILATAITSVLGYFGYVKSESNVGGGAGTQVTDNQTIDGNSDCNTQISDSSSGNTVNSDCSTNNNVENQENNEEKTEINQPGQYIEDGGNDNTYCADNDDTACSNDGTINNNPAR
jgi:hypothetical protein